MQDVRSILLIAGNYYLKEVYSKLLFVVNALLQGSFRPGQLHFLLLWLYDTVNKL
jgi:hypothetical protein